MDDLQGRITRLQNLSGSRLVSDGPGGRIFGARAREAEQSLAVQEPRYDVVVIGGYSFNVDEAPVDAPTVNMAPPWGYGEETHMLDSFLTATDVNAGSWSWGHPVRADSAAEYKGTHFAIAAILHGTRHLIPSDASLWWNQKVPDNILAARNVQVVVAGGAVTLTLTIGVLG